ncbi:MAG: redoxin domain-containing protein [Sulfurovum sp.]|nr:redoxin domain-containing protein [Sulfurovum sp.]
MNKLLATLLIASFTFFVQAKEESKFDVMSMTDITGKKYEVKGTEQGLIIKGLEGKVVFLEFFGHECPPCLASMPHLINLQKKHKGNLAIVAIEVQGLENKALATFAKEKGLNYTVVAENKAEKLVKYIQQRAQWQGSIPFLVALDPQGDVQHVQVGMLPEESLEDLISQLKKLKK